MENKIATKNIKTLIWQAGIPVIISMVLQALYNIIDTAFVINMDPILGEKANLALTYAFPIQIFMIAIGVGTGIGINALLSRYLGEKTILTLQNNKEWQLIRFDRINKSIKKCRFHFMITLRCIQNFKNRHKRKTINYQLF